MPPSRVHPWARDDNWLYTGPYPVAPGTSMERASSGTPHSSRRCAPDRISRWPRRALIFRRVSAPAYGRWADREFEPCGALPWPGGAAQHRDSGGPEHCGQCTDLQAASRLSSRAPCCPSGRPDSESSWLAVEATALPREHLTARQLSHLGSCAPGRVLDLCLLESPYLSAPVPSAERGQFVPLACTSVPCRLMRRRTTSGVVEL